MYRNESKQNAVSEIHQLKNALAACAAEAKSRLEALNGQIPGLRSLTVRTDALASSNADMMLDSEFDDAEALCGDQGRSMHVAAATYVRGVVEARLCLDYEA